MTTIFNTEVFNEVQTLLATMRTLCQLSQEYSDVDEFLRQYGDDITTVARDLDAILPFWASMAESAGVSNEVRDSVIKQLDVIKTRLDLSHDFRH